VQWTALDSPVQAAASAGQREWPWLRLARHPFVILSGRFPIAGRTTTTTDPGLSYSNKSRPLGSRPTSNPIRLDTSTAATDTIAYVATDQSGQGPRPRLASGVSMMPRLGTSIPVIGFTLTGLVLRRTLHITISGMSTGKSPA
jgi:hypothetical protein